MYGRMGGMEKTTVYLTTEQKAALTQAANAQGRTEARLIRAGIDAVTAGHRIGEAVASTVDEPTWRTVAPAGLERPRWIERDAFVRLLIRSSADPDLRGELRELTPGSTDDEPIP